MTATGGAPPRLEMHEALREALEDHPHARAVLGAAVAGGGLSHAYLLNGPDGSGKRRAARELAAMLLAEGDRAALERASRGIHPDLAWVKPRGAHEILMEDVRTELVAAASMRPFEAERRVFVIESAERLGTGSANLLLKTLEEPAGHVHVLLITSRPEALPATVRSRCQEARFSPPSEEALVRAVGKDAAARAAARLCGGSVTRARFLAGDEGIELRQAVTAFVEAALGRGSAIGAVSELMAIARRRGQIAEESLREEHEASLEVAARSDRARMRRENAQAATRVRRREETWTLDVALTLAQFCIRDVYACAIGSRQTVLNVDRVPELEGMTRLQTPATLASALAGCEMARRRLRRNVNAELALEAVCYKVEARASVGKAEDPRSEGA